MIHQTQKDITLLIRMYEYNKIIVSCKSINVIDAIFVISTK